MDPTLVALEPEQLDIICNYLIIGLGVVCYCIGAATGGPFR